MDKINGLSKDQLKTPSAEQLKEFLNQLLLKSWTAEAPQMTPEIKTLINQASAIAAAPELRGLNFYEVREAWKRAGARIYETQISGKNFRAYFVPIPGLQGLIYEIKSKGFKNWQKDLMAKANPEKKPVPEPNPEALEPEEVSSIRRRLNSLNTALIPGFGNRSKAEVIRLDVLKKCEEALLKNVSRETIEQLFKKADLDYTEILKNLPPE